MKTEQRNRALASLNEKLTNSIIENGKLQEENQALWDLAAWLKEKHPDLLKAYFDGMVIAPPEKKLIIPNEVLNAR